MTERLRLTGSATIGGTPVFSGIDLRVSAGQWTCLLGASGVGKSTVLRLFAGLAEHVDFEGHMGDVGPVALMAQQDLLLPWLSVLDNVLLGATLRGESRNRKQANEILAQVGLTDHATKRPSELSGGQRQRVALARTLMEDRDVVLLDEPFSALDALTRSQMQDLTAELLQGRTVLLVTHDPAEAARLGERIVVMTRTELLDIDVPDGPIPRPIDASAVLKAQADLLQQLRKTS